MSAYFQPSESEDIRTAALAWWADELQDWTVAQVVWGLRQWNRQNPRLRPSPGDILRILAVKRGDVEAERAKAIPKPEHQPREIVTAEQREAIFRELGAEHLAFGAKRFPTVGDGAE